MARRVFRHSGRVLLLACLLGGPEADAAVCRVTPNGSAFNDGTSWAVPVSLKQALQVAAICSELWLAKGVYKPGAAGETGQTFAIANGVAMYGGFAGTETAREQRDPSLNLTVLSGDIDSNDTHPSTAWWKMPRTSSAPTAPAWCC